MKNILAIVALITIGFAAQAQEKVSETGGIAFAEYSMQIESKLADVDSIKPPMAITDCELEETDIEFTHKDVTFSGGKHGTLERTWMAIDACGNSATAVQYIALRD